MPEEIYLYRHQTKPIKMNDVLYVLILEDEPDDVDLIRYTMEKSGFYHEYKVVSDKKAYERAIVENDFDLVLADNSVPMFNSMDALEMLLERKKNIPFILVTGAVSEEYAVAILQKGADDYILKESLKRLPAAINRALEKREALLEKEKAVEALRKSELRFRALIEHNADAIVIRDKDFRLTYASPSAKRLLGFAPEEDLDPEFDPSYHPDDRENMLITKAEILNNPGKPILVSFRKLNRQGKYIWVEGVMTNMLHNDSVQGIVSNFRDISKRVDAENELNEVNQELHHLSNHLQHIREEERMQISRDIHDELGQQLTGLKMDASWLSKKINSPDEKVRNKLDDMIKLIDEAVRSVRRISSDLRPSMLDDLGLVAALEWHSLETEKRFGIPVHFSAECNEPGLSVEKSTGIFRIYQEAMNNIIKHAQAGSINSSLKKQNNRLILEIRDDGVGIRNEEIRTKKTFGLLGIRERVFILGGKYNLESEPGKGTWLQIDVPEF